MLKKLKGALELLKNKLLRRKYTNYIDIKNNQKEIDGLIKSLRSLKS
jgi:hypothetical protein